MVKSKPICWCDLAQDVAIWQSRQIQTSLDPLMDTQVFIVCQQFGHAIWFPQYCLKLELEMWSKYTDTPASYLSNEQMGHATRKRYLSRQRPLLKLACAANAFYLCLNLLYFMHSISEDFDETAQMHMLLFGFTRRLCHLLASSSM